MSVPLIRLGTVRIQEGLGEADPESTGTAMQGRVYSGQDAAERAAERRRKFIEAGIEVFGTVGYLGAKVGTLCKAAGLSQRYFYESFESREALLVAVYVHLAAKLESQIVLSMQQHSHDLTDSVHSGMAAVVNYMLEDPRQARIMLMEVVGISAELEARREQIMADFAAMSMQQLLLLSGLALPAGAADPGRATPAVLEFARLTSVAMVGGVNNMLIDAVTKGVGADAALITEVSYQLISCAADGIRKLADRR